MKNRWWYVVGLTLFCIVDGYAATGLGQVANNLLGPTVGLAKLMNAVCLVAGIGFLLGGILQYKYHRENPQQVRISTPITFVLLGLALVAVPFVAMLSDAGVFLK